MSYLMDLHVYTNNSPETRDKISFLCETAVEKNLRAVAFTDEICPWEENTFELKRQVRHCYFDVCKVKHLFVDSLSVFAGIELREAFLAPEAAERILASQRYDIVLTSVSRFGPEEPFSLTPDMPQEAFNAFADRYCAVLMQTVEGTDFDVLSRILAPLRDTRADYGAFEAAMHPVLSKLAEKKKALEIDTRDILGSERIRDLYLRLAEYFLGVGGAYITFGSESISHDELGSGVELAMQALKRVGYSAYTFYEGRIPYAVSL